MSRAADNTAVSTRLSSNRSISSRQYLEFLVVQGLYLFALSWPLGAYQRIAGPVHLHHLALAPVLICALKDWIRNKRLRTPFELFWPAALVVLLAAGLFSTNNTSLFLRLTGLSIMLIAVVHAARQRAAILYALYLSVVSVVVMLLLSIAARFSLVYPTTFSYVSGLVMAGPYGVKEGIFSLLALGLLLPGLVTSARWRLFSPGIKGLLFWPLLPTLALIWLCFPNTPAAFSWQPVPGLLLFPILPLSLIVFWGCARIASKLFVVRTFMTPGAHGYFGFALILAVAAALFLGILPGAGPVFLLALLAAYAHPVTDTATATDTGAPPALPHRALLLPVAGLLILNLAFVLPGDPRDYDRVARHALATGAHEALRDHLAFVKELAPTDRRVDYYMARSWLDQDNPGRAASAFISAMHPAQPRLLPGPDEAMVDTFLAQMRDRSSALPERLRGLSYEQTLIAAGRERHALSLLALREEVALTTAAPRVAPLAAALAIALDAPHLMDTFLEWSPQLLLGVLQTAGPFSEIIPSPAELPESQLPLVALARIGASDVEIHVLTPAGRFGGIKKTQEAGLPAMDVGLLMADEGWGQWRQKADGHWALPFGMNAEVHISPAPKVVFRDYAPISELWPVNVWEVTVFLPAKMLSHE